MKVVVTNTLTDTFTSGIGFDKETMIQFSFACWN